MVVFGKRSEAVENLIAYIGTFPDTSMTEAMNSSMLSSRLQKRLI